MESNQFLLAYMPCTRVVNGFRIFPIPVVFPENKTRYLFSVRPNKSNRVFYFKDNRSAETFCLGFKNRHSDAYWLRIWTKFPMYHKEQVVSLFK